MTEREKEIERNIVDILKSCLNPEKIIIFGSRAKGQNNPSSDFDIAIQCEQLNDVLKRAILNDIDKIRGLYKVDIIYWREVDEKFKEIILETGRVIYEKGT